MNKARHEINTVIENLYEAQQKLAAEDIKSAIGILSIAKTNLGKATATMVNSICPEGTDGHINVDENGYPAEAVDSGNDNTKNAEKNESTSDLEKELSSLKAYLPGFDENELYRNYRRGLQYAIVYLANLADANAANSADVSFDNCDVMKLTFRTDSDLIKRNSNLAKEHLSKLFSLAGFKFAEEPEFSFSDGVLTVVFSFEKVKKSVNCYRIAPLLMLADIFGLI